MRRLSGWRRAVIVAFCFSLSLNSSPPALAEDQEIHDRILIPLNWLDPFGWLYLIWRFVTNHQGEGSQSQSVPYAAMPPGLGPTATFYLFNNDATTETGEQLPPGMTKTVWAGGTLTQASRVVIHTFGSDFDTMLAAYRGSQFGAMTRVVWNDNHQTPGGVNSTQSLIQFNAAANTPYRVQIGGKNGAEGDIYGTVSIFPPSGGLSAFLVTYDGSSWEGRSYICELGFGHGTTCPAASFIVHNSTAQALTVTSTTSLGGAIVNPPAFTLAAGAAKIADFNYNAGFNRSTPRTVSGFFLFTGRNGPTVVSQASAAGLISVKSETGYGPDTLRASVLRQVRTGRINDAVPFDVKLTNTGAQNAIGCHARTEVGSRLQTAWQEYDPGTTGTTRPATIGVPNVPISIPAGSFKWLRVWVASQKPRVASSPDFLGEIIVDCANTAELAFNTSNRFDVTQFGSFALRDVDVATASPTNGVLDVPASGLAKFRVSVTNRGPAVQMRVNGFYAAPFDDPPNSQFTVTGICEANAAGTCIGPTDGALLYNAPANVKKYFTVFVQAPSVNPGYDPTQRRVFLNVRQDAPGNVSTSYVLVGTRGIAVKKL